MDRKHRIEDFLKIHHEHIWWPFTPMKLAKEPFFIEKGEGVFLYGYDSDDNPIKFVDAISSWWVSIYGHNFEPLKQALIKQMDQLEHVIYASMEHEPALRLAEMLSEKTQHHLPRVFYSDDGSTAMEIAAKMAFQYFQNQGTKEKTKFLVLENGYHGDTSRMFYVGSVSAHAKRLCQITYECMWLGIQQVRPGAYLGDIGAAIQTHAEKSGYSIVQEFCGHGIGKGFHEEPQVLHYGRPKSGPELRPGMIFTVEPMINQGRRQIRFLANGWTAVTKDRSLSAQWEHTVLVTDTAYEVLTISPNMPSIPEFIK
ncbi:MAG: type I methionyl aminopeptidase [Leptonema sp. (in: bacteria)]